MMKAMNGRRVAAAAILGMLLAGKVFADVRLPRLLSDGAILQRDVPVTIWGWADRNERVQVFLDGKRVGVGTVNDGAWMIEVGPFPAGGPHRLLVAGRNRVAVDDIWFGDVWVAGGQSNMELTMERVATRFPDIGDGANYPLVREFKVPRGSRFDAPADDFDDGQWKSTTPESVLSSSAVAYFFARDLHERYDVPIGIISSNYGGSGAEAWMSETALEAYPRYLEVALRYRDDEVLQAVKDADAAAEQAWHGSLADRDAGFAAEPAWSANGVDDADWATIAMPGFWEGAGEPELDGAVWLRKTVSLPAAAAGKAGTLRLGRVDDADTAWVNGVEVGGTTYKWPPRIYPVPEGVLREGDNLVAVRVVDIGGEGGYIADKDYTLDVGDETYSLEGDWRWRVGARSEPIPAPEFVPWRQPLGFYNAMLAPLRHMKIKGVIWYQGETNVGRAEEYVDLFPAMILDWRRLWRQGDIPFLYVQLANYLETVAEPVDSAWAELREAQRRALRVPRTAMVVAIDVGEWNDIHPLDKETVGGRLALAARKLAYGEDDLVASGPRFHALQKRGSRLVVEFESVGGGLIARDGALAGFAIAGEDGRYAWADAVIDGTSVELRSDDVPDPTRVRYAWADNPDTANLYNAEGLPASPFQASITGRFDQAAP